jgi:hypothetical protein
MGAPSEVSPAATEVAYPGGEAPVDDFELHANYILETATEISWVSKNHNLK